MFVNKLDTITDDSTAQLTQKRISGYQEVAADACLWCRRQLKQQQVGNSQCCVSTQGGRMMGPPSLVFHQVGCHS